MTNRDVNPTQGFGATNDQLDLNAEERYWRDHWAERPYAVADRSFESYWPGYRYGAECTVRYEGRRWGDVERDVQAGWDQFAHRGNASWDHVKDAVRDAWDRVAHRR